jgi:hypothetical protein
VYGGKNITGSSWKDKKSIALIRKLNELRKNVVVGHIELS